MVISWSSPRQASRRVRLLNSSERVCQRSKSDPREFFRVGNDANRLDLPLLHLNGQDGEYFFASADDQGCLTVDFRYLDTSVLWPEALRSQAKACHRITPTNRTPCSLFDFPTSIRPQDHVLREQV